ncbi:MAG: hypothetical protein AB8H79_21580 [Myxococcota bacterium]
MDTPARSPNVLRGLYALLGIVVIGALIAWNWQLSPLLTSIASNLLRTSSSIALGDGWIGSPIEPFGERAPLMGTLIGVAGRLGLEPMDALRATAGAGYAVGIGGIAMWLRTLNVRPRLMLLCGVTLAPMTLLLRASAAELFFIGGTMMALSAMARHLALPSRRWLIIAAGAAGMAGLAHYMAVLTIIPIVVATAVLQRRALPTRIRDTAMVAVFAGGPIAIWMVRNQILTGHLTGMDRLTPRLEVMNLSPWQHTVALGRTALFDLTGVGTMGTEAAVYTGIAPVQLGWSLAIAAAIISLMLIATAGAAKALWEWGARQRQRPRAEAYAWILSGIYIALYVCVIIGFWSFVNNDRIQTRFLVALYPAVLGVVAALPALLGNVTHRRWPPLTALCALLILLSMQGWKSSLILVDHPTEAVVPNQWMLRHKAVAWDWPRWAIRHDAAEQYRLRSKARSQPVIEVR